MINTGCFNFTAVLSMFRIKQIKMPESAKLTPSTIIAFLAPTVAINNPPTTGARTTIIFSALLIKEFARGSNSSATISGIKL